MNEKQTQDIETIERIVRTRRTIKPKALSDRLIDDEVIWSLLESANWAPTHGMTEPWRFTIFTGDARKQLATALPEIYREITPPESFKQRKHDALATNPLLAPVLILISMKRQASATIPEIEEVEAVACAVQNLHLAGTAYGLGGFWSSNAAVCSRQMGELLEIQPPDRVLGLFYLGYPEDSWPSSTRQPVRDKVDWRT